jgi:hypothetical protein
MTQVTPEDRQILQAARDEYLYQRELINKETENLVASANTTLGLVGDVWLEAEQSAIAVVLTPLYAIAQKNLEYWRQKYLSHAVPILKKYVSGANLKATVEESAND